MKRKSKSTREDVTGTTPNAETKQQAKTARGYFRRRGVSAPDEDTYGPEDARRELYRWLKAAALAAVAVPALFYLQFGEIAAFGWGVTIFLVALCLLVGVGFYASGHAEYQTPVAARGGWTDRVGGFWLLACGFGPFLGWTLTSLFTLTADNWRWLYYGRAALSVGLPVLTALPLLRYARGRAMPIALALLLGVTALPVWSGWATMRDLYSGPSPLTVKATVAGRPDEVYTYLPHTNRVLAKY